jgi:hypothetical protein
MSCETLFSFVSSGSLGASFMLPDICMTCLCEEGKSDINQRTVPHFYPI